MKWHAEHKALTGIIVILLKCHENVARWHPNDVYNIHKPLWSEVPFNLILLTQATVAPL